MRRHQWTAAAALIGLALAPAVASGQGTTGPKWEVEGHGGFAASTSPTGGTAATLPVGAPYTTIVNTQSRFESSWLFGDGSALFNSVTRVPDTSGRITPLDPVIGSAAGSRGNGGAFGARVTRRLGSRYSLEFTVDYTRTPLRFTEEALDGIEASRASFVSAFRAFLVPLPSQSPNFTATTTLTEGARSQLVTTGVFGFDLLTRGRIIPFVVGGGGVVHSGGDGPTAELLGNYAFTLTGLARIDESDRVTIRIASRGNAPVGVFGGGVRYIASPRWGLRADLRFLAGGGTNDVVIDANPTVVKTTPGTALISGATNNPTLVFSSITQIPASLSGPAISSLRTFTGSGSAVRTNIAGGVYLRF
jgi:hypothetical protein